MCPQIASIEFSRVDQTQQAARTFDITVHVKDSSGDLQFSNLQRSDYKELFRFLTSKKIRIKNIAAASSYDDGAGGRDDDDDDDPYMATVRREREEVPGGGQSHVHAVHMCPLRGHAHDQCVCMCMGVAGKVGYDGARRR